MSMWKNLVALVRGTAHETGQSIVDAKALTILDQQIRDAGTLQAKARDDLATLTAKRRMIEKELEALTSQREKYEIVGARSDGPRRHGPRARSRRAAGDDRE
ncbi:PspA/IM30 family protein [Sphingomonas panni]